MDVADIALRLPAALAAVTCHGYVRARTARALGAGPATTPRLTLSPVPHIDPVGLVGLLLAGWGWGRSVPIEEPELGGRRRELALLAAGPLASLALAAVAALALAAIDPSGELAGSADLGAPRAVAALMLVATVRAALVLALLNALLPVPPLDLGRLAPSLLPEATGYRLRRLAETGGPWLLAALLATHLVLPRWSPFEHTVGRLLGPLLGLLL